MSAGALHDGDRRIGFDDGQPLGAADLRDDRGHEARMRGLHTRVVHVTWGISLGFDLEMEDGRVRVRSGLAHDCHGRELVLSEAFELSVPTGAADGDGLVLVTRFDDGPSRPPIDIAAVRLGGGLDPTRDRPAFAWRRTDDVAWGEDVPLGRVSNPGGQMTVDGSVRVYVRAVERPHVGFGNVLLTRTGPVDIAWLSGERALIPWVWEVKTDEGGFTRAPDYFAVADPSWAHGLPGTVLGLFSSIEDVRRTSFTLRLTALIVGDGIPQWFDGGWTAQRFELTWFGLEDVRGCQPPPPEWWFNVLGVVVMPVPFDAGGPF